VLALPLAADQLIAIPLTAIAVLTTMTGGLIALRMAHSLPTVIALSGGVVVAVARFDVLPEAIDLGGDDSTAIGGLMGAGFLTFFLFERTLVLHHRDEPADARRTTRSGPLERWACPPTASSTASPSASPSERAPQPACSS
jgi:hypothetical protein